MTVPRQPRALCRIAVALGIGALGIAIAHYPMIVSQFGRIHSDLGDSRLNHYLLEHGYRWVWREPLHRDFWSPPFFYPLENVAAYSEVLLGVGPVYWLWRALGAAPDIAFGLWMISISALNYAFGLLFFRRGLGFGILASSAAAFLVAFGAPRLNQLNHQQLLSCCYILIVLFALARLFRDRARSRWSRAGYWMLVVLGGVLQLYSGIYLGWFLFLSLAVSTLVGLLLPSCRPLVLDTARRDLGPILVAGLAGLVLLHPFFAHYLQVAREVESYQYQPVLRSLHPEIWSWLSVGKQSWIWGWTADTPLFRGVATRPEQDLGTGFVTPLACAAGLYVGRALPLCRIAALVALILCVGTTLLPGDTLALAAAAVSSYCIAALFYTRGETRLRAIGLAFVLSLVLLTRVPTLYVDVLGLFTMILCLLEIAQQRTSPAGQIVPGIALAMLTLKLFPLVTIVNGILLIAPLAALLAYYQRTGRLEIGIVGLTMLFLFLTVTTFFHRPRVLNGLMVAAPVSLAISFPSRLRLPSRLLIPVMLTALPIMVLYPGADSLWLTYCWSIPGASAIRAIGRVSLILLVPAAVGLAALVEFLQHKRLGLASWIVVLICLAEQGMTPKTFDAVANRTKIEELARQVDRSRAAFYYHPCGDQPYYVYHLDAMWASLESGVPTINGYSGYAPRAWEDFYFVDQDDGPEVDAVLATWARTYGPPRERIQWIGADCPRRRRVRSARAAGAESAVREASLTAARSDTPVPVVRPCPSPWTAGPTRMPSRRSRAGASPG
jgi:hypothetical protein